MSLYPHGPLPDIDTIDDPDLLEAILYGEDPTWQPERGPEEGEKEGAAINQDKATQDADSLQNDEDNKSSPDSNTPSSNTSQSDQPLTDTTTDSQQALDELNEETTTTTTTRPVLISTQSNHLSTLATIPQQAVSLSGMIIDTSITHPQLETHQEASSTSSPVVQSPPAPLTTASEPVNQEQQQPLPHQLYTETIPTPLNFTIEQPTTTQSTTHTNHNGHASPSPRIHLGPHPIPSNPLNNHPYNNIPPHPPRQPIQPHPFQPNFTPLLTQNSGIVKTIQSCTRNGAVRLNELENEDLDLLLDANMQYLLQYVAHRTSQRPPHSTHTQNDLEPGNIEPYGHQKLQYHAQHQLHSTSQPPHSTLTSLNTKQSQPQPHRNAIKTTPSPTEPPQRIGELHFKGLL